MIEADNHFQGRMSNKRKSDAVSGDPAFERWVARQLHKMYDDVLAEEVPAELLRLVERVAGEAALTPPSNEGSAGVDGDRANPKRKRR